MANQIGKFFAHQKHDAAVAAIEDHIRRFWDPRMRRTIIAGLDSPDLRLDPTVREAIAKLQESQVA
ncbi:MAG TPA: formate dehydrogenase subunit delta [Acetobacteraceae bacterium]|nr:formate dehydrogenase subunit delta [Acetobacteraceae bacterium]